ncbi:MAG: hypothetical protein CL868_17175 [Cytophagaceae bacterium]|nr:hypothetical protein [Cytophagaceae bacterium]|tara:strand:- start:1142 stop:1525 length:384 start_codon:yes stop_codon:yes gene_type:complete
MERIPGNIRLYNHALEILHLSRNISDCLAYDLSSLKQDGSEDHSIYFTGDIIRDSDSLAPEIKKAEMHPYQHERLRYADSVSRLSQRLYKTCERLERAESNGKDFVKLLRKEIRKFNRMHRVWTMTL